MQSGLINAISVLAIIHVVDGASLDHSAHGIANPRSFIVDHICPKIGVKPSLIGAQFVSDTLHGVGADVLHFIQTRKVVLNPPEPILRR